MIGAMNSLSHHCAAPPVGLRFGSAPVRRSDPIRWSEDGRRCVLVSLDPGALRATANFARSSVWTFGGRSRSLPFASFIGRRNPAVGVTVHLCFKTHFSENARLEAKPLWHVEHVCADSRTLSGKAQKSSASKRKHRKFVPKPFKTISPSESAPPAAKDHGESPIPSRNSRNFARPAQPSGTPTFRCSAAGVPPRKSPLLL